MPVALPHLGGLSALEQPRRNPEDSVREKTREIVEKHVDVTRVKEDIPIYKVGEEHLEDIRGQEPAARASSIAHAEYPNHGPRFWRLVGQHVPDYQEKNEWLKENGTRLVFDGSAA